MLLGGPPRFAAAKREFHSQISGKSVKMLYLSASTTMTLDYGDIVGLTAPARLAVSTEAVWEFSLEDCL